MRCQIYLHALLVVDLLEHHSISIKTCHELYLYINFLYETTGTHL